jgi:hypothetical protein
LWENELNFLEDQFKRNIMTIQVATMMPAAVVDEVSKAIDSPLY